jgi:hypothetical protein
VYNIVLRLNLFLLGDLQPFAEDVGGLDDAFVAVHVQDSCPVAVILVELNL